MEPGLEIGVCRLPDEVHELQSQISFGVLCLGNPVLLKLAFAGRGASSIKQKTVLREALRLSRLRREPSVFQLDRALRCPAETKPSQHEPKKEHPMRGTAEFMIVGRIGKLTKLGKTLKINIASDYPYKDDKGEWVDNTHWNTVTVFNAATLTWAEKNLVAGDLVQTKGRLKNGSYEKDGDTVYTTDLIATDLSKLAGAPAKKKRAAKKVAA